MSKLGKIEKSSLKGIIKPYVLFILNIIYNPVDFVRLYLKYLKHVNLFKKNGGIISHKYMVLTDYKTMAGTTHGHYFHQDLLVAQFIHEKNPKRHIDIGSRIDGFVTHVASYRKIEVMDVRDLSIDGHKNISFVKADLMNKDSIQYEIADSISCLHAIEHFGLGRYGDPIDPQGHKRGFNNILRMLKKGGTLYISFPIGEGNQVHFNAHRVFHPKDIFTWADTKDSLKLERFDYIDDSDKLHLNVNLNDDRVEVSYGCGIYSISKQA